MVLSLPDGSVSAAVLDELLGAGSDRLGLVVQTSTIGVGAARAEAARAAELGVAYVDAPVSGGIAGARSRTLTVMVAASDDGWALAEPTIAGLSDQRRRVGDEPGMAQAMKLANNFLSATALAATSEALRVRPGRRPRPGDDGRRARHAFQWPQTRPRRTSSPPRC